MKNLLLSLGISSLILGVNLLPVLAQSTNSYTRCRNNPNEYCLRRGDRGQLVRELISNLTCLGYYSGVNDGIFGSRTETGIRNFQRHHSLTVDGIAGPQTRNFLAQQCNQNNVSGRSPNTNLTPNIENLANGVYLYCDLSENAPRELQAMCFSFRKTGNSIVGFYYPDRSDFEEICLEGVVNGNTVSGFALESIEGHSVSAYLPSSNGTTLVNWDKQGYFKVAERQIVASTPNDFTTGWIRYNSASINLNNFVRWSHQERVPNSCTITDINNSFN